MHNKVFIGKKDILQRAKNSIWKAVNLIELKNLNSLAWVPLQFNGLEAAVASPAFLFSRPPCE